MAAIYEPPQHGSDDGLELLDDPQAPVVESVAAGLGLRQVGWVFTDLEPEDLSAGTVKYKRYVRCAAFKQRAFDDRRRLLLQGLTLTCFISI